MQPLLPPSHTGRQTHGPGLMGCTAGPAGLRMGGHTPSQSCGFPSNGSKRFPLTIYEIRNLPLLHPVIKCSDEPVSRRP